MRQMHRTKSEDVLLEGLTVRKSSTDLYFYVIGNSYENELMLLAFLNCLFNSDSEEKKCRQEILLENTKGLFLATDKITDGG